MSKLTAAEEAKLPDSAFAYIDKDGDRHLPIHDKEHAQDALGRWSEQHFDNEAGRDEAAKKIVEAAEKFGIDVDAKSAIGRAAGMKVKESKSQEPRRKPRSRRDLERQPEFRLYKVPNLEIRDASQTDSGLIEVSGQVIMYEVPYEVFDPWGSFTETVHYGSAAAVLASESLDVRFLFNHQGMPLARTGADCSLVLSDSPQALNIRALIDPRISLANDLSIAIERGLVTQMSVGMEVDPAGDVWSMTNDGSWEEARDIYRLADIFDTSAVTYPASPTTSIQLAQRMWSAMPVESRERTRRLWHIARDGRSGRQLSQAESDVMMHALERLHDIDIDTMSEMRDAPGAADTAVATAIQQAQHALQIALDAQAKDPGNGTDPDDEAVEAALQQAKTALDKASQAQSEDGSSDPDAAKKAAEEAEDRSDDPDMNADGTEGEPPTGVVADGTGIRSRSVEVDLDLMRLRHRHNF